MNGATYVENSGNRKIIGSKKADATYVSIKASCPTDCPFMGEGCYAELGNVGITSHRLDKEARRSSPLDAARAEAKAIDNSYKGKAIPEQRDLRLHVAGDSRTVKGARVLNKAIGRWTHRGGGKAWTYTHAWKHVPRKEWSNVSVLASIQNVSEVDKAKAQGYTVAIVVPEHPTDKAYQLAGSDMTFIPCPQQTRGIGCSDCRLCMKADWLFETNRGIAFAVHGVRKEQLKRHLTVVA